MELELQKQLRAGKTPAEICDPLGIDFKELDGKILFSYDMISSYKFKENPIVMECRGLILYKDTWDVASMAFSRFFNYGETGADKLPDDLSGCLVLEKRDGTMISLRFDKITGEWEVSTRNMIYAEGPVNNCDNITFEELFWEGAAKTKLPMLADSGALGKECTYVFELTGPKNRIVTPYKETTITLLTIRNNNSLLECERDICRVMADMMECDLVKAIELTNWKELLAMESCSSVFEGYVVVKEDQPSHLRVKVKNPSYLAISKMASSISERGFLELIKEGKHDDYLTYFPEYKEHIEKLLMGLDKIINVTRQDWNDMPKLDTDADYKKNRGIFARAAYQKTFPHILFDLYDNKVCMYSMPAYLIGLKTDSLLDMIHKVNK